MYYKKFSDKEMQVIREAIQLFLKSQDQIAKKELVAQKIQKKLVHCYYLERKGGAN